MAHPTGIPVNILLTGGIPIIPVPAGTLAPTMTPTSGPGVGITLVDSGGHAASLVDEDGEETAYISLDATSVSELATVGTAIGELSVANGSGSYTFTIADDPDSKFAINVDGVTLETADTLDYETTTSHLVTIEADNGSDPVISRQFNIIVTDIASVPDAFVIGDWSVADATTGGKLTVTVASLPESYDDAITLIEYRVDGGAWTDSGITTATTFDITGLTDDVEVSIELRSTNAIGASEPSDVKTATPTTV